MTVGQTERSAYCEHCGQPDYTDKRDPASWHVCPDEADEVLLRTDFGDGPAITCLCGTNIRPLKPLYDPLRQGWLCSFCGRVVPRTKLEEVA